ncbi:HEAT repeat domain-containing protein, partial [Myxococcota bacterium]|nr:HEAT repeat domain-containing protein [Myxococcota bacterium]
VSAGRPVLEEAAVRLSLRRVRASRVHGDAYAGPIAGPGGTAWLELRSRLGGSAEPLALPAAIRTCDSAFDRRFVTSGRPAGVAARLDATLRQRLVALVDDLVLTISDRGACAETRRPFHARAVVDLVAQLAEILAALGDDGPLPAARLLTNGLTDPDVAVRYQNLDLLLREHPTTPEARDALRLAWQAPERGIRYLAAIRGTSEEATSFLEETIASEDEPVLLRTMALKHLARHAPLDRVRPLLHRALGSEHSRLRGAAIELLGRLADTASLDALIATAERPALSVHARAAVARALGAIGDVRGEDRLLTWLADPEPEVKIAAATALGRAGSSRALGPLTRVASRYVGDRELSSAASSAAARIEARVGPVDRGRLSVLEATSPAGALAFPDVEPGALALTPPKVDGSAGP